MVNKDEYVIIYKRAQYSAESESEAQEERRLSELEYLLATVGLEMMTKSVQTDAYSNSWRERFQILEELQR